MNRVVVIGAGGFGRETLDVIEAINAAAPRWHVDGVVDDAPAPEHLARLSDRGISWIGSVDEYVREGHKDTFFVVAIGSPAVRKRLHERLLCEGLHPATLVHPSAGVGSRSRFAPGTVICAGVQVSTNVSIGAAGHLNPNATIGHDSSLGDWVSVNPGAIVSGEVSIGNSTLVGAGAVVLQGLAVGDGVVIGAAACVTRSVADGRTVKGVPAR